MWQKVGQRNVKEKGAIKEKFRIKDSKSEIYQFFERKAFVNV